MSVGLQALLLSVGVPIDKLKFRVGSEYQLKPEFTLDVLKISTMCSQVRGQLRVLVLPC